MFLGTKSKIPNPFLRYFHYIGIAQIDVFIETKTGIGYNGIRGWNTGIHLFIITRVLARNHTRLDVDVSENGTNKRSYVTISLFLIYTSYIGRYCTRSNQVENGRVSVLAATEWGHFVV